MSNRAFFACVVFLLVAMAGCLLPNFDALQRFKPSSPYREMHEPASSPVLDDHGVSFALV